MSARSAKILSELAGYAVVATAALKSGEEAVAEEALDALGDGAIDYAVSLLEEVKQGRPDVQVAPENKAAIEHTVVILNAMKVSK